MHKAVTKEGPRAPLFYLAASIALLLQSSPAWSQMVDISALQLCAELETPELKVSCFEAIIASNKVGAVEETRAAAPPAMQTTAAGVSANAVAPKPAAETLAAPGSDLAPASAAGKLAAAPESDVPPASATGESPAATVARGDEFGQEYLVGPEQEQERDDGALHATVIEVSKGRNDILYFHLDNGQLWRQNEARHYPYPKNSEFEVDISRGMMGEYRLRIGDNGRMVRIRRVK